MKKSKLKKKRFETDILKQKQAIGILTAEELQDAIDSGLTTEKLDEVPIGDPSEIPRPEILAVLDRLDQIIQATAGRYACVF
jgi:hypothetical protein